MIVNSIVFITSENLFSEVTPSRSGLRKRKRAESPDRSDPIVTEEWVDEDKVELWEIKFFGERQERKSEPKPGTPATRTKSGVTLNKPEKYDPSSMEKERPERPAPAVKAVVTEPAPETLETELKMQRAVLLSKRDNHAKAVTNPNKTPTPTASQLSQQLRERANAQANAATSGTAGSSNVTGGGATTPRSYAGASTQGVKKIFVTKSGTPVATSTPDSNPVILTRKIPGSSSTVVKQQVVSTSGSQISTQSPGIVNSSTITLQSDPGALSGTCQSPQKITVFRTPEGKLQVKGLLPGQSVFATADGKICLSGTPTSFKGAPGTQTIQVHNVQSGSLQSVYAQQQQQQTRTIVVTGQPGQLQQSSTPGVIHVQNSSGGTSQVIVTPTASAISSVPQQVSNQPLINISNPAMRTVITSSQASTTAALANSIKAGGSLTQPHHVQVTPGQVVQTYMTSKGTARKVTPKGGAVGSTTTVITQPSAGVISAGTQGRTVTGTINAQGQLVLTHRGQVVSGQPIAAHLNQQGQIVFTGGQQSSQAIIQQGTIVQVNRPVASASVASSLPQIVSSSTSGLTTSTITTQQQQAAISSSAAGLPVTQTQIQVSAAGSTSNQITQSSATHGNIVNLQSSQSLTPGKLVIQDGGKAIMIGGQNTISPQQLQNFLASQLNNKVQVVKSSGGTIIQQQQSTTGQIIQQANAQQPQSVQLIQGSGGQMQLMSSQAGVLQAVANAQAQGQHVIIQSSGQAGHQVATIGGQPVFVKKVLKPPVKPTPGSVGSPSVLQLPPGVTGAQLQQLISQGKGGVLRIDGKTGAILNMQSSSQQQQTQIQTSQHQQQIQKSQPIIGVGGTGATTVTRTPGLPISIVSPSKAKLAPTSLIPPHSLPLSPIVSVGLSVPSALRQTTPGIVQTAASGNQVVTGSSSQQLPVVGGTQVVAANQGPQVVTSISSTKLIQPQQQQVLRTQSPVTSPLGRSPHTSTHIPQQSVITSSGIVTKEAPVEASKQTTAPPQEQIKSPMKSPPPVSNKLMAQILTTPEGVCKVVITSPKPPDVTDAHWEEIRLQLQKQFENSSVFPPVAKGPPSSMKVVVNNLPSTPQKNTTSLPPGDVTNQSLVTGIPAVPVASGKTPKVNSAPNLSSPVKHQQVHPASSPSPTKTQGPVMKTPPNSANVDAAIDAVAADVDGPVCEKTSQARKGTSSFGAAKGTALIASPKKSGTILKNILEKPDPAEVAGQQLMYGVKSSPPNEDVSSGKKAVVANQSGKKKSASPKKPPQSSAAIEAAAEAATAATALMQLTPVEQSSVPQPIEQDVVISTSEPADAHSKDTVLLESGEGPRFVLSQDLLNQSKLF